MGDRIGLFGGSFNPIHYGHLIAVRAVAEQWPLDRVVFLPCRVPPHKQDRALPAAEHRAAMVKLAIAGDPAFEFSAFDLIRTGPCYSIDVVEYFEKQLGPGAELCWIIGADSLMDLPMWHRAREFVGRCQVITASRPGANLPDWNVLDTAFGVDAASRLRSGMISTPQIDISSSLIRERVAAGRSIRYLVPSQVEEYITNSALYRAALD